MACVRLVFFGCHVAVKENEACTNQHTKPRTESERRPIARQTSIFFEKREDFSKQHKQITFNSYIV